MRDANYTETIEFLSAFFRDTEQAVELRALRNNGGATQPLFTRDPDEVVAYCQHYDGLGWGVYFGLATRDSLNLGGKRENLRELPCLWAEIDIHKFGMSVEQAVAILLACPLPPSLIVSSGRGLHVYWLLSPPLSVTYAPFGEDAEKTRVELVTRSFVRIFRGDPNAVDLTRVLRLPGTHNTKEGTLLPCRVLEASWARYELEQVEAFAALSPVLIAPEAAPSGPTGQEEAAPDDPYAAYGTNWREPFDMGRLDLMSYQDADNPIHQTRLKAAASMVQRGELDDEAIFERLLVATHRAAGLAGERWDWRREEAAIHREIASAHEKWPTSPKVVQLRPREQVQPEPEPHAAPDIRNDIGNALQLLALHRARLCYVVEAGWHVWDGKRFRRDNEMIASHRLAHDLSAQQLAAALRVADKDARKAAIKWAISSGTQARISAMLHEARPYVAHQADDMDANIWLLNCQNGVLDLRNLSLRPHSPADLITKICGTAYDPNARCPRWERFLVEIFNGDQEMIRFVQYALGYSLTGAVKENVFFILHGTGKNGKSKLLEAAAHVLGDYMMSTPADTWAEKPPGAASNDVAALPGARFVTTNETEKNHSLRAGLVKQITGGDKVSARKMYRDFFEFTPQCKLWIATNNKPKVSGSDGAVWDRIRLLPFNIKFVPKEELIEGQKVRDNDLMDKLLLELPGILAWMVRGCTEWQRSGLPPAVAMTEAAAVYRASQDSVQGYIDECCDLSHGLTCAFKDLYAAYEIWCGVHEEEVLSKKAFGANLEERGYPASKSGSSRLRKRLDLKEKWRTATETGVPPKEPDEGKAEGT